MTTFSYTDLRTWGHDYSIMQVIDGGKRLRVCLFTPQRPKDGDYVILPNGSRTTRYQVDGEVDTPVDPGDQHFCNLVFAPRSVPSEDSNK